jgi:cobalt-zinc-cadmium efflux system outer membrane protein
VGITIPLPVFNKNQGAIIEAENRIRKAEKEKAAAVIKVQTALSEAYQTLEGSFLEGNILKDSVLPSLQNAYDATLEGYRYGKFGYLDVLDSQRTLFEAKAKYLDVLASFQKSKAEVQRLIGFRLEETLKKGELK